MFLHIQQHIMHIFIHISFLTVISFLPMFLLLSISYYSDMFCSISPLDKFVNTFLLLMYPLGYQTFSIALWFWIHEVSLYSPCPAFAFSHSSYNLHVSKNQIVHLPFCDVCKTLSGTQIKDGSHQDPYNQCSKGLCSHECWRSRYDQKQ